MVNKWKWESRVSKTLLCWKQFGWLVKVRSMHVGLSGFLKHVFLMKLVNPFKLQNSSMYFSFVVALKSPKNRKFWHILLSSSMMQLRRSRWFDMKLLLGLYTIYEPLPFPWIYFNTNRFNVKVRSEFDEFEGNIITNIE